MREEKKKKTFLEWLDNIWYYYKWYIVVGICALIMFGVALFQQCSKVDHDAFVYYAGPEALTVQNIEELRQDLQAIMPKDFNKDGKKVVDYKEDIFLMYTTDDDVEGGNIYNKNEQLDIVERFNMELRMGECLIYILDAKLFKANKQFFCPLDEILDKVPQTAVDGIGIRVSDLKAYSKTALKYYPDDAVICLREKRKGDKDDFYLANLETFKAIVEFK